MGGTFYGKFSGGVFRRVIYIEAGRFFLVEFQVSGGNFFGCGFFRMGIRFEGGGGFPPATPSHDFQKHYVTETLISDKLVLIAHARKDGCGQICSK